MKFINHILDMDRYDWSTALIVVLSTWSFSGSFTHWLGV